ncbi:MAG: DsbA family protein [Chloroflexota bacterium]|nr:DsbA family protein [Chloroflexota bacterium]
MHLIVYFDYTCPYSYAAAVWLRQVSAVKHDPAIAWRPFVVKEVNRAAGEGPPFWEQEAAVHMRTGFAFLAGQAAARQGGDAADRFRFLLQTAFHTRHLDIREPGVLEELAREAGLDVARFEADRQDTTLLAEVGRSHLEAVARYGVFGTPTLVFSNGCAVYLKLAEPPSETSAPQVFALLRELVEQHPIVQEIKLTRQEGA